MSVIITSEEEEHILHVRNRINVMLLNGPIPVIRVSPAEYEACEKAVLRNLEERHLPPICYADKEGRLLFKGIGLEIVKNTV